MKKILCETIKFTPTPVCTQNRMFGFLVASSLDRIGQFKKQKMPPFYELNFLRRTYLFFESTGQLKREKEPQRLVCNFPICMLNDLSVMFRLINFNIESSIVPVFLRVKGLSTRQRPALFWHRLQSSTTWQLVLFQFQFSDGQTHSSITTPVQIRYLHKPLLSIIK